MKVGPGGITAGVQGSEPKPYRVKVKLKALTDAQWEQAIAALEERPMFVERWRSR